VVGDGGPACHGTTYDQTFPPPPTDAGVGDSGIACMTSTTGSGSNCTDTVTCSDTMAGVTATTTSTLTINGTSYTGTTNSVETGSGVSTSCSHDQTYTLIDAGM
jgi:hypothetical protein